jgi:hypothetical protein
MATIVEDVLYYAQPAARLGEAVGSDAGWLQRALEN